MSNNQQGDQKQGGQKQIRITDNLPGGEYANAMQINHNKEEFHLNFLNIMGLSGKVSGKIITNPSHFKRMIAAMQENLEKYESQYGKIEEAQGPINKEIGFKE
jgi:DNA gyrase inhibitor GyrI